MDKHVGRDKADEMALLAGRSSKTEGKMGLAGARQAKDDDNPASLYPVTPCQL